MNPYATSFMGAGLMMQGMENSKRSLMQSQAEAKNADFYREQANFAQEAGDRQLQVFDRQSKVQYGEEMSAFAKAGIDTAESAGYLAREQFYGSQEKTGIRDETAMNVRLANLRADAAQANSKSIESGRMMQGYGMVASFGSSMMSSGGGE